MDKDTYIEYLKLSIYSQPNYLIPRTAIEREQK